MCPLQSIYVCISSRFPLDRHRFASHTWSGTKLNALHGQSTGAATTTCISGGWHVLSAPRLCNFHTQSVESIEMLCHFSFITWRQSRRKIHLNFAESAFSCMHIYLSTYVQIYVAMLHIYMYMSRSCRILHTEFSYILYTLYARYSIMHYNLIFIIIIYSLRSLSLCLSYIHM